MAMAERNIAKNRVDAKITSRNHSKTVNFAKSKKAKA